MVHEILYYNTNTQIKESGFSFSVVVHHLIYNIHNGLFTKAAYKHSSATSGLDARGRDEEEQQINKGLGKN